MAKTYEDLVPGDLWEGDVCCVDDPKTGQPKLVAIHEPTHLQQYITTTDLAERPALTWSEEKQGFYYLGASAPELSAEADGQEN